MTSNPSRVGLWVAQARSWLAQLPAGGRWALAYPEQTRSNLRWFWLDGLFASASDKITITYLSIYILALGASSAQIGFMSSLTSLAAALVLIPGALLVERIGRRKQVVIWSGGGVARLALLVLAALPFFLSGGSLVGVAIGVVVVREVFAFLSLPAWTSLTAAIVPMQGRGRYFGSRFFVIGVAGILSPLLVGEMITRSASPLGFQLAFGLSVLLGLGATFSFSRIQDPAGDVPTETSTPLRLKSLVRDMRQHRGFLIATGVAALWNFSLNIAGPFFSVYQVTNLGATATMVGITAIASSLSSMIAQPFAGRLADRWGFRKLQLLSSLVIPILPWLWLVATSPWHIVINNFLGGILWAGYTLASFNMMLYLTPDEQRARYSALHQIVVTLSLAAGAALGGLVVAIWGFKAVFFLSGLGRLLAALVFARWMPNPVPQSG